MNFHSIYDQGFARVAAATIPVHPAQPHENAKEILAVTADVLAKPRFEVTRGGVGKNDVSRVPFGHYSHKPAKTTDKASQTGHVDHDLGYDNSWDRESQIPTEEWDD
ncbi:hypothetical protein [Schaalia sp. ZJ1691]|uniref:hypothetical protein n=1 Tax=Schaalia sp. ZJ1691 TaxID=2709404 RepID=UPI0013ECF98B|nr:hypothetical protein [Schaalia sp. ZJ1691]